jgi:hypothetical protein
MIAVLEGNGTHENPYEEVRYIINGEGEIIGKVDANWQYRAEVHFEDTATGFAPTP